MTDHSVEENASESEHSEDDTTNNATISRTRTYLIAGTVGLANICWGIMDSLPGAFYPNEAESKGANPSEYGFVFGIIHLGKSRSRSRLIIKSSDCLFLQLLLLRHQYLPDTGPPLD